MKKDMPRRDFLKWSAATMAAGMATPVSLGEAAEMSESPLPMPSWQKLPRWRGFNLLEKFIRQNQGRNPAFREEDFQWMADWGFNFVRLPMDYRTWIVDGDWRKLDESVLKEIDQAVDFGIRHNIHVCINFHRAPGYTVARPQEAKLVWDDAETLDVCTMHWRHFAKRYAGISNRHVSFNLFNEPALVPMEDFLRVHRTLCEAIRAEDSGRLMICDGMAWGTKPTMELLDLQVAQATRGYMPMEISHYRASWVGEYLQNMEIPPTWPLYHTNGMLFSPQKSGILPNQKHPMRIALSPDCGKVRFQWRVGQVSHLANFYVEALNARGEVVQTLFHKEFRPGKGEGEWTQEIYKPQWKVYQNYYGRDYSVEVPAGTVAIQLRMAEGDWMSLEQIVMRSEKAAHESLLALSNGWKSPVAELSYTVNAAGEGELAGGTKLDRQWHQENYIVPWKAWENAGGGVMVGEFGAYNKTPHHVVLSWMEDLLRNWKEAGWGWALWNLRGSIGILDSGREDVAYEDFHGHQLDRKMLDLLLKY